MGFPVVFSPGNTWSYFTLLITGGWAYLVSEDVTNCLFLPRSFVSKATFLTAQDSIYGFGTVRAFGKDMQRVPYDFKDCILFQLLPSDLLIAKMEVT